MTLDCSAHLIRQSMPVLLTAGRSGHFDRKRSALYKMALSSEVQWLLVQLKEPLQLENPASQRCNRHYANACKVEFHLVYFARHELDEGYLYYGRGLSCLDRIFIF